LLSPTSLTLPTRSRGPRGRKHRGGSRFRDRSRRPRAPSMGIVSSRGARRYGSAIRRYSAWSSRSVIDADEVADPARWSPSDSRRSATSGGQGVRGFLDCSRRRRCAGSASPSPAIRATFPVAVEACEEPLVHLVVALGALGREADERPSSPARDVRDARHLRIRRGAADVAATRSLTDRFISWMKTWLKRTRCGRPGDAAVDGGRTRPSTCGSSRALALGHDAGVQAVVEGRGGL